MKSKQNGPRKHHFVPVFFQKYFLNPNGLLWVYDRETKSYKELHPRSICFQNDLYAFRANDGARDARVESGFLKDLDGASNSAIKYLANGGVPNNDLLHDLSYFAALQFVRVPSNGAFIKAMYEAGANDMAEAMFGNIERAKASIQNYVRETGDQIDVSAESMVKAVQGGHLRARATEAPFLHSVLDGTRYLGEEVFPKLDWHVLISPPEAGFILSDSPMTTLPPVGGQQIGFLIPGSSTYLPLTRRLCLRLGFTGKRFDMRNIDRKTVRCINQNTAANSERFILGPDRPQLESIVKRTPALNSIPTPRFVLEKEYKKDGILRTLTRLPRHACYPAI